ncbi:hypothetical protein AA23498_1025 [Acetobacter nitrogenifigens DSM 23921 = NBRC 105050]|uniref:DUF4142 domain-containing protein n=1 Tax=Acetobacter nitrogenifigens DSM 23921 = NBRC 105050 TaxID=1120919 RepID=A0A511XAR9_9PROT|nr:DUF4142 domain-containing protein [Acetobacter nitrogenifigens]GBQ90936.1 hypothetical protein AA23498_1025 [Acetobacter nitrogenifigens DSM 23921 = NBRC 105050]GEN60049.1 hypothetical protein ANI02nite_19330 [Acetobacter nitrogenifigens DSM 23921 = NBRC 105050]
MKQKKNWLAIAAMLPLAACADHPKQFTGPLLPAMDEAFVHQAAESNLVEIAISNAESSEGHSANIKTYAGSVVTDHTADQDRLSGIAKAHGFTLPSEPTPDDQKLIERLTSQKGSRLDHAYLAEIVKQHKSAEALMKQEATTVADPDLKSYVADMQVSEKAHLQSAEKLSGGRRSARRRTAHTQASTPSEPAGF